MEALKQFRELRLAITLEVTFIRYVIKECEYSIEREHAVTTRPFLKQFIALMGEQFSFEFSRPD